MIGLLQKAVAESHEAQPVTASLFARTDMGIHSELQEYPFDLFIDESHGLDFKLSEHPLQDGSVITDHVTQQLRTCKIAGMFTNHSLRKNAGNENIIKVEGYENAVITENTALKRYEALERLAKQRMPVRLVTSIIVYPRMIIKQIRVNRTEKDGERIRFTMTLSEFKEVKLYEISVDKVYSQKSMKDEIDRLTATVKKAGLVSGTAASARRMLTSLGVQQ